MRDRQTERERSSQLNSNNLIVVKAPEFHAIKTALGLHLNLLGHQPVVIIDHRQHMMVLVLVLEFERSICLELFLDLLQQFLQRRVDPDKNRPRVNVMALHAKLLRTWNNSGKK